MKTELFYYENQTYIPNFITIGQCMWSQHPQKDENCTLERRFLSHLAIFYPYTIILKSKPCMISCSPIKDRQLNFISSGLNQACSHKTTWKYLSLLRFSIQQLLDSSICLDTMTANVLQSLPNLAWRYFFIGEQLITHGFVFKMILYR